MKPEENPPSYLFWHAQIWPIKLILIHILISLVGWLVAVGGAPGLHSNAQQPRRSGRINEILLRFQANADAGRRCLGFEHDGMQHPMAARQAGGQAFRGLPLISATDLFWAKDIFRLQLFPLINASSWRTTAETAAAQKTCLLLRGSPARNVPDCSQT